MAAELANARFARYLRRSKMDGDIGVANRICFSPALFVDLPA
jgi:hypothetical protein